MEGRVREGDWVGVSFATGKTILYHVTDNTHISIGTYKCKLVDLVGVKFGSLMQPIPTGENAVNEKGWQDMNPKLTFKKRKRGFVTNPENDGPKLMANLKEIPAESQATHKTFVEIQKDMLRRQLDDLESDGKDITMRDNRNLVDVESNQKLSPEEVENMKKNGESGKVIIKKLKESSNTFHLKTDQSQEKYITSKQKKHSNKIRILRPTSRIIGDVIWERSRIPGAILAGLRPIDTVPNILFYGNVTAGARILLSENTSGYLTGSILHRLNGDGEVIETFLGPTYAESRFLQYFNLTPEQSKCHKRCDITKLLAGFEGDEQLKVIAEAEIRRAGVHDRTELLAWKKRKEKDIAFHKSQKLVFESLNNPDKMADSVIICSKIHPRNTLLALMKYLKPSGRFVVFSQYIEPLVLLKAELQMKHLAVNVKVIETFLRKYQVASGRTHPEMRMSGASGFLLVGTKILSSTT